MRVDYQIEGYHNLGMACLNRSPLAFLTPPDRGEIMGGAAPSLYDLPPSLTLFEMANLLTALEKAEAGIMAIILGA